MEESADGHVLDACGGETVATEQSSRRFAMNYPRKAEPGLYGYVLILVIFAGVVAPAIV